ncbi:elongin-C [Mus pahari]|uniref:elongin-C n=1 Tax=Mus pahari TaxID=10093 RepID=UPI001114B2A9|nr:elongin-C [Mus pahari]
MQELSCRPKSPYKLRIWKILKFLWAQIEFYKNTMDGEEKTYGGCEGPDAMYVKLISSDGHEFIVKREHALTSGTIKAMLSGPGQFAENETNETGPSRRLPASATSSRLDLHGDCSAILRPGDPAALDLLDRPLHLL